MSDGFKIQLNVKVGEELINLRADSPAEAESLFNWAFEKADAIAKTISTLKGTQAVAQGLGGQTVSVQTQPQQSWSNQGSQQQYQPQQAAGPQGGKTCIHGDMTFREGVSKSSGKPYKAYFCPAPKGTPNQCSPEFVR